MIIYLIDSDKEAIEDFVKDHVELHDKSNDNFNDKVRKDCLWERVTSSTTSHWNYARLCSNPKALSMEN